MLKYIKDSVPKLLGFIGLSIVSLIVLIPWMLNSDYDLLILTGSVLLFYFFIYGVEAVYLLFRLLNKE